MVLDGNFLVFTLTCPKLRTNERCPKLLGGTAGTTQATTTTKPDSGMFDAAAAAFNQPT